MSWIRMMAPLVSRRDKHMDPEFLKVKTQLANVATALEACVRGLEELSEDYRRLYKGISSFANDFYSLYPSEDDVRRLGKATVSSADALLDAVDKRALDAPETASIYQIDRQIKAYLQEIRTMQAEFKNIASAKAEWESAQGRLERLDARGRPSDQDRRTYFYDLAENRRLVYETMLEALTRRLASTYNKHAQVFQAAWTAYILRLEDGKGLLEKHMRQHRAYAKRLEKDVVKMQLVKLDNFDENQFQEL
jgi:hypothetical protein